jgi:SAM-dependent methyltransferase
MPSTDDQWTNDWNHRFLSGDTPWEEPQPTPVIGPLLRAYAPPPARVLEVGCGLGTNAIHLAQLGYDVIALDVAEEAILQAARRGRAAGVSVDFRAADFLSETLVAPTELACVFDKGCLHSFRSPLARLAFIQRVASVLRAGGLWLNISGSADNADAAEAHRMGYPRLTATELVCAAEPSFQLLELRRCHYGQSGDAHFLAWAGVFQRR